ncbi:MAG: nucleotidyltransferase domain-containing protein [Candidatus Bathyarchaeia archaeon]
MEYVTLKPEGEILLTLSHGKHTYTELRFETGLSDRWLTVKLGELAKSGHIEKEGRWYQLKGDHDFHSYEHSLYMTQQGERMAAELTELPTVEMIILFGSVAQKKAGEDSDMDLIIVLDEHVRDGRSKVLEALSELESRYHLPTEAVLLSERDFLENIYRPVGGIVYGLAEGYNVYFDKTENISEALDQRVKQIKRTHDYLEEEKIWVKKR